MVVITTATASRQLPHLQWAVVLPIPCLRLSRAFPLPVPRPSPEAVRRQTIPVYLVSPQLSRCPRLRVSLRVGVAIQRCHNTRVSGVSDHALRRMGDCHVAVRSLEATLATMEATAFSVASCAQTALTVSTEPMWLNSVSDGRCCATSWLILGKSTISAVLAALSFSSGHLYFRQPNASVACLSPLTVLCSPVKI